MISHFIAVKIPGISNDSDIFVMTEHSSTVIIAVVVIVVTKEMCMDYNFINSGVNSSSRYPFKARTDNHTN